MMVASLRHHSALPSEPMVLDTRVFQELLETLAGDLDIVVSIYRTFLVTATTLIGSLPDQDCAGQAATLHTLKGSASMIGAARLARLAAHLQRVAAKSVHPVINTRGEELTGELSILRTAINTHVRSLQNRPGI
jgi:HPt (histidine-containing phosphotransfer) domain-containing protein